MSYRCLQVGNTQIRVDAIDRSFDGYHSCLLSILYNFENAFVQELDHSSVFNGFTVAIRTLDVQPIQMPPTQLQPEEFATLCSLVNQLLLTGHLSYSTSLWSANPFIISNPSIGIQELGVNYCSLNNITLDEDYRMATYVDVLNSITYSECFSLIVLKDPFKQLALDEQSKSKTAFIIPGLNAKFEWNVVYGGLKNAQVHLQRALDYCLNGLDPSVYKVYMGQILVHTIDMHQHLCILQKMLGCLVTANLRLDVSQCIFLCSTITYLGMGLSPAGVAIRPEKIERVKAFGQPTTRNELQTFLGLIGQYQRYVPDYEQLVLPLIRLENKNQINIRLNEKERWTFEALKTCFLNASPIPLKPSPMYGEPNGLSYNRN